MRGAIELRMTDNPHFSSKGAPSLTLRRIQIKLFSPQ